MAKRKLSPKKRLSIRKEMRKALAQKTQPGEIIKTAAKKYGISTVTARWYLKSIVRPGKPSPSRKPKAKRQAAPRQGHRIAPVQPTNGALMRVVQQVQSVAEKTFKRALEVKNLIPKWQVYVRKEASLRQLEDKVKAELRSISAKAEALHRRIRSLTTK